MRKPKSRRRVSAANPTTERSRRQQTVVTGSEGPAAAALPECRSRSLSGASAARDSPWFTIDGVRLPTLRTFAPDGALSGLMRPRKVSIWAPETCQGVDSRTPDWYRRSIPRALPAFGCCVQSGEWAYQAGFHRPGSRTGDRMTDAIASRRPKCHPCLRCAINLSFNDLISIQSGGLRAARERG